MADFVLPSDYEEFEALLEDGNLTDQQVLAIAQAHTHLPWGCEVCEQLFEFDSEDIFSQLLKKCDEVISAETLRYFWENWSETYRSDDNYVDYIIRSDFGLNHKADLDMFNEVTSDFEFYQMHAGESLDITEYPEILKQVLNHPHGGEESARKYLLVMHQYGENCAGDVGACEHCQGMLNTALESH